MRPFGGVVWIVVLAVLLAGIVAVNVAVLQLNVRLDELGRERVQLQRRHEPAQLPALERVGERPHRVRRARKLGLVRADPELTFHVQLAPPQQ